MMDQDVERFSPDKIDEQVEQLAFADATVSADAQLVQRLYELVARDEQSIERVRGRLQFYADQERPTDTIPTYATKTRAENDEEADDRTEVSYRPFKTPPKKRTGRVFTVLAAMLVIGIIVGSLALFLHNYDKNSHPAGPGTPDVQATAAVASHKHYLYVVQSDGVFKLDLRTKQVLWSYPIDEKQFTVDPLSSVSGKDYVFFTANRTADAGVASPDYLFALDVRKGALAWQKQVGTGNTPPQLAGDVLYMYTGNANANGLDKRSIAAYSAKNGEVLWSRPTHGQIAEVGTVQGSSFYVTEENYVYALSTKDGHELWSQSIETSFVGAPQEVNGQVYTFACSKQNDRPCEHFVYDAASGRLLWQHVHPVAGMERVPSGPTVVGDRLYQGSGETGEVYALDVSKQGQQVWKQKVGQAVDVAPVVSGDTVYVSVDEQVNNAKMEGHLVALNARDGSQRWVKTFEDQSVRQVVVVNDVVYCAGGGGIQGYRATDGRLVQEIALGGGGGGQGFMVLG